MALIAAAPGMAEAIDDDPARLRTVVAHVFLQLMAAAGGFNSA